MYIRMCIAIGNQCVCMRGDHDALKFLDIFPGTQLWFSGCSRMLYLIVPYTAGMHVHVHSMVSII